MSKGIYVGKLTSVPIYGTEVTSIPFNLANFNTFFYISSTNASSSISGDSVQIKPTSGTASITLTALYDLTNVHIAYYYRSSSYPVTISINGVKQTLRTSSTSQALATMNLTQGDTITATLKYTSASASCPYINIHCDDLSIENTTITGYEEKELARKVNTLYAGVESNVPIYEGSLTELNIENVSHFFTVTQGTQAGWGYDSNENNGLKIKPVYQTGGSIYNQIYFTALHDLTNVSLEGSFTAGMVGYLNVVVNGEEVFNKSASQGAIVDYQTLWSGNLSAGDEFSIAYTDYYDMNGIYHEQTYVTITCDSLGEQTIVGYEKKDVARKIVKGYIGVNGVARKFLAPYPFISYTGDYTITNIEQDNQSYTLYTLTSSGILELADDTEYWMCGGGGSGGNGNYTTSEARAGGGGGGGYLSTGTLSKGEHIISIGIGGATGNTNGSATTIDDISANGGQAGYQYSSAVGAGQGGSGGGCSYGAKASSTGVYSTVSINGVTYTCGLGAKISTYPFNIEELEAHCAGGAGGYAKYYYQSGTTASQGSSQGLQGGSNGSSGSSGYYNSKGGTKGGGNTDAAATFYGGGGGGGSAIYKVSGSSSNESTQKRNGQAGYQGVVYLLIPN